MTTNGSHLESRAYELKHAGLRRVNVSLHTLDPVIYKRLCGRDELAEVITGIKAAISADLNPVKVNMVVFKDENESEITQMIDFCRRAGAVLQLIEYESDRESLGRSDFTERYFSLKPLEETLAKRSNGMSINDLHRRRRYRLGDNGKSVEVEFVRPMHNTEFCANCTRIRLSSNGRLKPCLLSRSGEVDVLTPLREGASEAELRDLFLKAVSNRRPYWS